MMMAALSSSRSTAFFAAKRILLLLKPALLSTKSLSLCRRRQQMFSTMMTSTDNIADSTTNILNDDSQPEVLKRGMQQPQKRMTGAAIKKQQHVKEESKICSNDDIKVTTYQQYQIPTNVSTPHNTRLTLTDYHLRDEQLPFCYFFKEHLDSKNLRKSLEKVLIYFPILGGQIASDKLSIQCQSTNFVPLTFGTINTTLTNWLSQQQRRDDNNNDDEDYNNNQSPTSSSHCHHDHIYKTNAHPTLLPLFDSLFEDDNNNNHNNNNNNNDNNNKLATIRVTYFECGGTAIGVNMNHILGDTASCVRFVQCWGKEMRKKVWPKKYVACFNNRHHATTSVMMTEDLVEIMNYGKNTASASTTGDDPGYISRMLSSFIDILPSFSSSSSVSDMDTTTANVKEEEEDGSSLDDGTLGGIDHEYVHLTFPPEILVAMKAHGMMTCCNKKASDDENENDENGSLYVSTNDMVTAYGWLLKRALSGNDDWDISVVVNIRGKYGIDNFSDMKTKTTTTQTATTTTKGVFGNGITNVIAKFKPTSTSSSSSSAGSSLFDIDDISQAAISIRKALHQGNIDIPDRIAQLQNSVNSSSLLTPQPQSYTTFATTSWSQFPVWNIKFTSKTKLIDFHGHPAHPLPTGETFSSVIMSTADGSGCIIYKLMLPSNKANDVRALHQIICTCYLEWYTATATTTTTSTTTTSSSSSTATATATFSTASDV